MKEEAAQLLLYCPDKQGILAEVTDFITVNKGNIIYLDQYVDHAENVFFMRISWDLDGFLIPKEKIEDYFNTLYAQKYQMTFRLYFSGTKPKMAIFVSKMSHCLYDMLARYTAGEWNVEIPLIISNHPELEHIGRRFDIPFYVFPINKENKEEQERAEMELLAKHQVNFIVLARYMQIISERMIEAFPNRIINIHPSLIPSFCGVGYYGLHVHEKALERGVRVTGATVHFVDTGTDTGPIILQKAVKIKSDDTPEVLQRRVMEKAEWKILPKAINLIANDKVKVVDGRVETEEFDTEE